MSLDFGLYDEVDGVLVENFNFNITHNLWETAEKAGIYDCLWRPDEHGYSYAKDIIVILKKGLKDLKARPEYYKQFDAKNGWGLYIHFVPWVEKVLRACKQNPNSRIIVSR